MNLQFRILVFVLHLQIAVPYKPYKFNKLCPTNKFRLFVDNLLDDKPHIELENSNDLSGAVVAEKWDDKTYESVKHCDFRVTAKSPKFAPSRGIFASIRKMKLRKSPRNECIDYLIFEVGNGEKQQSRKMCGVVDGDDVYEVTNFFDAPGGTMKVIIYISRYLVLDPDEHLEIDLSFTAYDDCSDRFELECQTNKCISTAFFNDTILNCPPPDCKDEPSFAQHCQAKPIYEAPSTHVLAISALTSLLMVMFGIVTCWYCFKFRDCAELNQSSNRNDSNRTGTVRPDMEFQTIRAAATPETPPTAPSEEHDNPPSYESLFSDRKVN